ncbi:MULTISPECIES: sigma-54-dependent transcriptional regulator [Novilysobacter]|uniref:sigma-54-dependent transcriptional regulator n=1 Tax=Novilysobacter TaxID=3382699 RepID=UPI002FC619C4
MPQHSPTLLIVDDDHDFAQAAADFARARGFTPYMAHSLEQSRRFTHLPALDLMLLDLTLPDGSGFDLLDDFDLLEHGQIAVVTGQPSVESAAKAVSLPVVDYLIKPLCPEQFEALLSQAAARAQTTRVPVERAGMIGECGAIQRLHQELGRVAPTQVTVLISGESGTGKELVARAVHEQSGRRGPFVAVNCGAIAPDLLASHLFGHERGSFTGAATRHVGFFEQANRGTLFLDEITEMPPSLQVYLLRVLETATVTRVGGSEGIDTDVRVVAATNREPMAAVEAGALREDLFYRLADFHVELPPLRSRGRDVVLLAQFFLDRLNAHYEIAKRFAPGTDRVLLQHRWPGNVRELRSAVQRAFLVSSGHEVKVTTGYRRSAPVHHDATTVSFTVGTSYAEIEREMLLKTLAHFDNDRTRTAEALGVSVRTIHNQLARLRGNAPTAEG